MSAAADYAMHAATAADDAWKRLFNVATAPATTNDPYMAAALFSIAAELRAIRKALKVGK